MEDRECHVTGELLGLLARLTPSEWGAVSAAVDAVISKRRDAIVRTATAGLDGEPIGDGGELARLLGCDQGDTDEPACD